MAGVQRAQVADRPAILKARSRRAAASTANGDIPQGKRADDLDDSCRVMTIQLNIVATINRDVSGDGRQLRRDIDLGPRSAGKGNGPASGALHIENLLLQLRLRAAVGHNLINGPNERRAGQEEQCEKKTSQMFHCLNSVSSVRTLLLKRYRSYC